MFVFANWKPYTNPRTNRSGWISDGGLVRYTKPTGKDDKIEGPQVQQPKPTEPKTDPASPATSGSKFGTISGIRDAGAAVDTAKHIRMESGKTPDGKTVFRWNAGDGGVGEWSSNMIDVEKEALGVSLKPKADLTKGVKLGKEPLPKSKSTVDVSRTSDQAQEAVMRIFDKKTPEEAHKALAESMGMPDDAKISVGDFGRYEGLYSDDLPMPGATGVRVSVHHPKLGMTYRFIGIDGDGKRFIKNEIIEITREHRASGMGAEIFSKQVESAAEHGFSYIVTHAASGDGTMNGYATWPKFGYDQSLTDPSITDPDHKKSYRKARAQFPEAKSVLDILASPGGVEWWSGKKNPDGTFTQGNGTDMLNARFDLSPDSRSVAVLSRYMEKRAARSEATKTSTSQTTNSPTSIPSGMTLPATASNHSESPTRLGGCPIHHFAEPLPLDEVALAGKDGQRAAELLRRAKDSGTETLNALVEKAVRRLLASGNPLTAAVLFDDEELKELQSSLSSTIATADLMGRVRISEQARLAEERAGKFSEDPDPFHRFDEPPPAFPTPESAIEYFQRLHPALDGNPLRYGPLLERHAFTLAVSADQVILEAVKKSITERLVGRTTPQFATADIQAILDTAGVSPRNPQYAEMVYRTNLMDAYNQGAQAELQSPTMQEFFPAWRYDGINDSRAGDDHRPKFGRYYPASAPFAAVRGPRVWNCRCSFTPVDKYDLAANKYRIETTW